MILAPAILAAPPQQTVAQWERSMRAQHAITIFDVEQNAEGRAEGLFFIAGTIRPQVAVQSDAQRDLRAHARAFVLSEADFFGIAEPSDLAETEAARDRHGNTHVSFIRTVAGLQLDRMTVIVHLNDDGTIHAVNGDIVPITPDIEAAVARADAASLASDRIDRIVRADLIDSGKPLPSPQSVQISMTKLATSGLPHVIWEVEAIVDSVAERWRYRIDAVTGEILEKRLGNETHGQDSGESVLREVRTPKRIRENASRSADCAMAASLIATGEVVEFDPGTRRLTFRPLQTLHGTTSLATIDVTIPDPRAAAPVEMPQFTRGGRFVLFLNEPAPGTYELCGDAATNRAIDAMDRVDSGESLTAFVQGLRGVESNVASEAVFDLSKNTPTKGVPKAKPVISGGPLRTPATDATQTIFSDGFEGAFPGSWQVYDADGSTNGSVYWDDVSNRSYTGSWSVWCADGGANASTPAGGYRNNMKSWMVYGPFNLSDATAATFSLKYWLVSETNRDYLYWYASPDGVNWGGYVSSGNSAGWKSASINLASVPYRGNLLGDASVWIAVAFISDYSLVYEGAYVDDVLIQKTTSPAELGVTYVDVTSATNVAPGGAIDINSGVRNNGTGSASGYTISFYASTNTTITSSDIHLATFNRPSLGGGITHNYASTVYVPYSTPSGPYYIGALITFADSNSANNTNYDPITVNIGQTPQADLSLNTLDAEEGSYQPGDTILIDTSISNIGNAASTAYRITYYVSTDATITTGDTSLGYLDRAALGIGGSTNFTAAAPIPSLAAGYYYVGAILNITDGNSSNNVRVDPTRIRIGSGGEGARIGTGTGVLGNVYAHVDTYYDTFLGNEYFLEDVSRRASSNPHGHNGGMASNASIKTQKWSLLADRTMSDADNVWNATDQRTGVDAHVGAARFYDYLRSAFSWNSPNNAGSSLVSSVDAGTCADNAFWNGSRVSYCNGVRYAGALDVVGHEWAHAVTQLAPGSRRSQLQYEKMSGALNEAFSDWFGVALERNNGENNWTIGEGINLLRNVAFPSQSPSPQPEYVGEPNRWYPIDNCTPVCPGGNDCCGVHTNSGVPNKMFYLLAQGGTFRNVTVAGVGFATAIDIAFDANVYYWTRYETFLGARNAMITVATNNYGTAAANSVRNAWSAVGVGEDATCYALTRGHTGAGSDPVASPPSSTGCIAGQFKAGQSITLTATPSAGWRVRRWTGTANNASTATTNSLLMPASSHTVTVEYTNATVIVTATSPLRTTEFGGTASFTVRLASQPTANVSFAIQSSDTTEGTVFPASVTFTPADWSIAKTITVTGVNDTLVDGDVAYTIVLHAISSTDPLYNGYNPPDLPAVNADNESTVRGDFNGDGKSDIVLRNYATGVNQVWLMNGASYQSTASLSSAGIGYRLEGTADFDGDGKTDILWRNHSTGANLLWLMNGTTFRSSVTLPSLASSWRFEGTGDFNGDGKADILARNYSTGQNMLWLMNGTAYSSTVTLPTISHLNTKMEGSGDFNGDGKADIVFRNYSTGANFVWAMNGTIASATLNLPSVSNLSYRLDGVADFNGDRKPDLVWRNYATGGNILWLMNYTAYSSASVLPAVPDLNMEIGGPK